MTGTGGAVGFRGPQVCSIVGITYRQLDYWARTGLLQPSVAAARGSGTRRVYSYSDVLELKVIKQLLDEVRQAPLDEASRGRLKLISQSGGPEAGQPVRIGAVDHQLEVNRHRSLLPYRAIHLRQLAPSAFTRSASPIPGRTDDRPGQPRSGSRVP